MSVVRLRFLLFALALVLHAFSPVASIVMAGGIARAGLSEICLKAANDIDQGGRSAPGHAHGRDCPLCQSFCDGAAPVGASTVSIVAATSQWSTLQWSVVDSPAPDATRRFAYRARAPPTA